jgi:hypothetical protein
VLLQHVYVSRSPEKCPRPQLLRFSVLSAGKVLIFDVVLPSYSPHIHCHTSHCTGVCGITAVHSNEYVIMCLRLNPRC